MPAVAARSSTSPLLVLDDPLLKWGQLAKLDWEQTFAPGTWTVY